MADSALHIFFIYVKVCGKHVAANKTENYIVLNWQMFLARLQKKVFLIEMK